MTSSRTPNGRTAQSGSSLHLVWSPPPVLLETAAGDDGFIANLIDSFTTDAGAGIKRIRAALGDSNFSRIRAEAHSIKGGARQMGAHAVADACEELETVSTLREAALVASRLDRVQELLEDARRAMAAYSRNPSLDSSPTARI